MGLFMAMFGVTTVIGPLIGGLFVEYASWRWIFYINVPIGVIALFVTGAALPSALTRLRRIIDYLGTALLAAAATALVVFTSLGGTTYAWGSPAMVTLAVAGVVLSVLFVIAERRATEPVIPLHLFTNKVFTSTSAIGFVVGFAMFGALSFLPLFFQIVRGTSPTDSGLRLFPMMGGLLVASIGSGQIVSRWGRYKVFPVVGTAFITVGLYLMSGIGVATSEWLIAAFMVIFGLGLGLVMQVLVVAVQNAVSYEELGTATSSVTFFRMIGGSFGTAVFGAIFANVLAGNLLRFLHGIKLPPNLATQIDNPTLIAHAPAAVHLGISQAIAHSVDKVFLIGTPIAFVSFLLSWLLPEVELRKSVRTVDAGEGLAVQEPRTSLEQIQLNLQRLAQPGEPWRALSGSGRAGGSVPRAEVGLVAVSRGRPSGLLGRRGGPAREGGPGDHRAGAAGVDHGGPHRPGRRAHRVGYRQTASHCLRSRRRRQIDHCPPGGVDRAPRRLGPRGTSGDRRHGEPAGCGPARRRRQAACRRSARLGTVSRSVRQSQWLGRLTRGHA